MNKKGQGLPMNTVIMTILVIVVLILVLTFLFGGFTGLSNKIRLIFYGSLAGTSKTLAIQNCNQYCSQLQLRSGLIDVDDKGISKLNMEKIKDTPFCKLIPIDEDEDGNADKLANCKYFDVTCSIEGKKIDCPEKEKPLE